MDNQEGDQSLMKCPECGLQYRDPAWAKQCAAWCAEHHSCNLEIIAHAVNNTE